MRCSKIVFEAKSIWRFGDFFLYSYRAKNQPEIRNEMLHHTTSRREQEEYGEQILTKAVKAGRRTYFFDVRATRADDYFLTITESRKMTTSDGNSVYDRHKIFLYKEDFAKFADALSEVVDFIRRSKPEFFESNTLRNDETEPEE